MDNALTRLLRRAKGQNEPAAAEAPETGVAAEVAKVSEARTRFSAWLGRPMTSFHLIVAVAGLLTTLGLTMVLSASGVRSYGADGSAWVIFGKQVMWTIIGLGVLWLCARVNLAHYV